MTDQSLLAILREPVLAETRANLARSRERLLPRFRTPSRCWAASGVTFRRDGRVRRAVRALALAVHAPRVVLGNLPAFARYWLRRLDPQRPVVAARDLLLGRTRLHALVVVSHHFMSQTQLGSPMGKERLAQCVFHVHARGETMSMCEANALGGRDRYYAELRGDATRETIAAAPTRETAVH